MLIAPFMKCCVLNKEHSIYLEIQSTDVGFPAYMFKVIKFLTKKLCTIEAIGKEQELFSHGLHLKLYN